MKHFLSFIYFCLFLLLLYVGISFFIIDSPEENIDYLSSFEGKELSGLQDEEYLSENIARGTQLAFVDVNIEQGSFGKKDWELQADWATYVEASTNLYASKPVITYWDRKNPEASPVHITGEAGRVLNKNTIISLRDKVLIEQDDMTLTGEYVEFLPTTEEVILPEGGILKNSELLAKANIMQWNMPENRVQAQGNVVVILADDGITYTLDMPKNNPPEIKR